MAGLGGWAQMLQRFFYSLVVMASLLLNPCVNAGDLLIGGISKHFDNDQDYNENNYLIGYHDAENIVSDWVPGRPGTIVALYKNSHSRFSAAALLNWNADLNPYMNLGASLGLATGYGGHRTTVAGLTGGGMLTLDAHPKGGVYGVQFNYVVDAIILMMRWSLD